MAAKSSENWPHVNSVVWAKMKGYPWWPAVVLPESEEGEWARGHGSAYRCVFFQDNQSFGWIVKKNLRPFSLENSGEERPKTFIPSTKTRNSFQYKAAVRLGRQMLENKATCRKEMVFDSPSDPGDQKVVVHLQRGRISLRKIPFK